MTDEPLRIITIQAQQAVSKEELEAVVNLEKYVHRQLAEKLARFLYESGLCERSTEKQWIDGYTFFRMRVCLATKEALEEQRAAERARLKRFADDILAHLPPEHWEVSKLIKGALNAACSPSTTEE